MLKGELLRKGFLFENFTQQEIESFSLLVKERLVPAGQYVFRETSPATSMYIIESGVVEIVKEKKDGVKLVVAELTPGSHFGEMPFLDRGDRSTSAIAKDDVRLHEISYDDMEKIVSKNPEVGRKIYHSLAKTLCQRIRQTTEDFSHVLLS